jgi:MFS family permease
MTSYLGGWLHDNTHARWIRPIGMGTFMSVNNTVIMGAVPGNLRGFASGMLETTRQGGHLFTVPLVSSIMTGVAGVTLTAQADPALYIRGFQAACMVVGCIGLIALAFAFVPEARKLGEFKRATLVRLADSPRPERGAKGG